MHRTTLAIALGAAALLTGCGRQPPCTQAGQAHVDWHEVVTASDAERLRGAHDSWVAAVAKARAGGGAAQIAAQGALFDPDRALESGAIPPPGRYRCRVFKLGANGPAMKDFTPYPAVRCDVANAGDVSMLRLLDGAQRPAGRLFSDSAGRGVFLGTLMLGDEREGMRYGQDTTRDMAGFIDHVAPRRWRLALPSPHFESMLDVIELTPAPTG